MKQLDTNATGYTQAIEEEARKRSASSIKHVADPEGAATRACTSCGTSSDADAVFCKRCGTRLPA
jgi:hypothetical protein